MKTKRIWAWVLCIVMLLTLAPVTGLASGADTAWAAETETWLSNTDNKLYVGEIRVTAENAADIIGSYTGTGITGTAYFRVENGVPTLYLSGVTIETGFKIYHYSREWYNFYGIYYKPASDDSLKIHFSGRNMINVSKDIAENKTFGIHANYNCKKLEFIGEENAYLGITAEQQIIAASGGALGLYGGEYNLLSENGSNVSSETLYCVGDLTIKDTAVTAVAKDDRAIWMNAYINEAKSTRIQNSTVHLTGGTDSEGLLSCGDLLIENSVLNTTGGKNGISCADGKAITISGADTVVTAESVGTVNELRHKDYAAMYTCADRMERILPDITFNDGLSITTPAGGTVGRYDFDDLTPGGYEFNTVFDTDGNYARKVVIGLPTGHCVCGKDDCDLHTGAIMHVTENSLNRVSGIVNGVTLTSGSYYLSDDLTMNDNTTLTVSGTINLCLNGHTLRAYIVPNENAVLNICDCVGGGKISYTNKEFIIGFVHSNAVVNMYGGTLESVDANTVGDIKNLTGAAFNLYGGTISGGVYPAIGSESITLNLYSGKVTATGANGIVAQNGKVNLCGNTEISVLSGYHSIKVYNEGLIDATGYTGGNISILCSGLSDGDIVVENVTDATAGKFTLSNSDSNHILKRDGNRLIYAEVYTVTFDANGGSGTMADAAGVLGAYSLPECTFTAPTGKKFKAWKVNNTEYAPGTSIQVSSAMTVTAVWKNIVKEDVRIEDEPQSFVYDGLAKGFAIRANVTGGFTVTYEKDGNAIAAPTDAGSYDVVIRRDADETYAAYDKTIKDGLIITPMDITGKASAENFASMTYNGNAQTPQAKVTANGFTVTGSWSAVTNVADTTTFTATGNFTGTIADQITGMKKASITFAAAPVAKFGLIYNGSAQTLLETAPAANGGTIKYSIDDQVTWQEELPKGTNAGQYVIYYKAFGDGNYNDSDFNLCNVSIAKANITVTAPAAIENLVYSGAAQALTTGGSADGGEIRFSSAKDGNYSEDVITATNAGSYEVWYKVIGDNNHNDTEPAKIDVSIAKAGVDIPAVAGKAYTGEPLTADISGSEYYDVRENNGGTQTGRYDVKLVLKDSSNYRWNGKDENISEVTVDFTIAAAENGWTLDPFIAGWTYGALSIPPSFGAKFGNVTVEYKKATEDDSTYTTAVPSDAGDYQVRLSVAATNDYGALSKVLDFSIAKANITVTAPAAIENLVYSGAAQALTTGGSADGGEIRFSSTKDGNYSEDVITATNAGNYEVWYKVIGDNNHNDTEPAKIDVSIAKARQSAPETPAAENETIKGKADGKITGVDNRMEYKMEDANEYTAIDGNEIANLAAGTYKVRYQETDNYFAGDDKTIEIADGAMITVAFETGGGSAVESKTCAYNQTITAPETEPTKEGYAFAGWFADEALTAAWDFAADTLTENKTLYAKWVQGTVSKDEGAIDAVTADGLNDVAKTEKTDISLTVQVQEAAETNADQTAIKGISDAPKNFGFYDITLKKSTGEAITDAQSAIEIKLPFDFSWKRNIKVYRCHDGNAQELTQLTERNTVKPFTDGTCFVDTENGCIYIYSSKFSTYSVAYDRLSASSGSGSGGLTRFTVRFETNGAAAVKSQTVPKGGTATALSAPVKDGYQFGGWYLDANFTKAYDFTAKVTENITLYAKWNAAAEDKEPQGEPTDTETHDCPSKEFDDLDINLWYHPDTDYVLSGGLMNGTAEKTFAPDENLTRAMLVTVLYRNEGEPAADNGHSFTDVEKGAYYENAVSWAQQNGVVKGISETEFAPDAPITREQIAAILHRYAQWKGIDVSVGEDTNILSYRDFDMISEYAIASLQWAAGTGLLKGRTETTLNPRDNATRAEIAAILHRFLENNQ